MLLIKMLSGKSPKLDFPQNKQTNKQTNKQKQTKPKQKKMFNAVLG